MTEVSVIIATHNRAKLVCEAVESVLAQTVPVHEVIVVDDGSTDETRQTLARFGNRIRAVFQSNQGASAARNLGMRLASGSWLAFLDDDDVWLEAKVAEQLAIIERDPSLGLVYCSDYAVDHGLRIMRQRLAHPLNRGDVFEKLLIRNFIFTSCVMARRDAVEEMGLMDLKLVFAQDWDLWLKIAAKYPVDFAEKPLVYYRHSPTGCLTKDIPGPEVIKEVEYILERACGLRPISCSSRRLAYHHLECLRAATWLREGRRDRALEATFRALGYQPYSREALRLALHSVIPLFVKRTAAKLLGRNGNGTARGTVAGPSPTTSAASFQLRAKPEDATKSIPAVAHHPAGSKDWPPVLILNMSYSGLGIARNLAGKAVRVVGLSADSAACGHFTRLCDVRSAPNSQNRQEEFVEFLLRSAKELAGAVVFPTRDADVLVLDRYREQLEPHFRLAIPTRECLRRVVDKYRLVAVAREAGVPVPQSAIVASSEQLARIPKEVGFPCVVKPVSSIHWRGTNQWKKVGARKAFLVRNMQELLAEYETVAAAHPDVLVQEWIPGGTDQIVVLGGYVDESCAPLGYFTARKLVQSPDDFGTGCLVETVEVPALLEPTKRLWKALGYEGMAEVEYKLDPRSGLYKLIEINPRHWDWHQLGLASGVNLTWIAYCHLIGRSEPPVCPKTVSAKWIAETDLFYYLIRALYRRQLRPKKLCRDLSGRRMYAIFAWSDPLPSVRNWFCNFLPSLGKQVINKLLRGNGNT